MKPNHKHLIAMMALCVSGVNAAAPTYNTGDIILGFRATAGTGQDKNVVVNLGSAAAFRDHTLSSGSLALGTLSTDLAATYGSGWATRSDLKWGAAGTPSNSADVTTNGTTDPATTVYYTKPEGAANTVNSTGFSLSDTNRGIASSLMLGMQGGGTSGGFSQSTASATNSRLAVQDSTVSNNWSTYQPGGSNSNATTSFKAFNPTIEGLITRRLDLFRTAAAGSYTYLGTLSINSSGVVTFTAPATGFTSWAASKGLTASNNGTTQDPDHDGTSNLLEYVLGGNPLASDSTSTQPVQSSDSNNVYYTFNRSVDSKADTTQKVQWSTDLATWHDIAVGSASSSGITVTPHGSSPETVSVAIPRTNAAGGRLFVRLSVTK